MQKEALDEVGFVDAATERSLREKAHIRIADALRKLETVYCVRSVTLFEPGGLQVKMYALRGRDPGRLHSRE